jgi:hypothetical protein
VAQESSQAVQTWVLEFANWPEGQVEVHSPVLDFQYKDPLHDWQLVSNDPEQE